MKRFWLVLLSLGLVMTFSASAFAVDVKVSGEYFAAGMYLNKTAVEDVDGGLKNGVSENVSTAFFYQRLRVGTDFIVSPCLKLVTRFDAMERIWGGQRSDAGSNSEYFGFYEDVSAGSRAENENIAFDLAYINYVSPIGTFTVGYQNDGAWGTVFGDSTVPLGQIGWSLQQGGLTYLAQIVKADDFSKSAVNTGVTATDLDFDKYAAGVIFNWKGGEAGVRYIYARSASWRTNGYPYASLEELNSLQPYAKVKIGPVTIQSELDYYWGYEKGEDGGTYYSGRMEAINFFLDAVANFNMFYVGGTFAYLSGDDPNTDDKKEGGTYLGWGGATNGGIDWNPCLIMFNYYDLGYWVGAVRGYNANTSDSYTKDGIVTGPMNNAWFFQGRVGVKPTPRLDAMLSVSYAQADKKPYGFPNGTYGTEIDLTGTYKITNNLSYMLGFGYLFTGDYFKGYDIPGTKILDDYTVINKLTLSF